MDPAEKFNIAAQCAEAFRHAWRTGDTSHLSRLLAEKKYDISSVSLGYQNLLFAVKKGSLPAVSLLLDYGADPDATMIESGHPKPLHVAIKRKNLEMAHLLLKKGASPELRKEKMLLTAVTTDQLDMVRILLAKGANPDFPDYKPLKIAVQNRQLEVVRSLLEGGANPNYLEDESLLTLVRTNQLDLLRLLVDKIPDQNKILNELLLEAVENRQIEALGLLLDKGVDANQPDGKSLSAAVKGENLEAMRLLLYRGADPNLRPKCWDRGAPLVEAVKTEQLEIVRLLVESGADPNRFKRILSYAISEADLEMINYLMDNGAVLNEIVEGEYQEDLAKAVWTDRLEVIRLLLDRGADFNIGYLSTLKFANYKAYPGHTKILEFILEHTCQLWDNPRAHKLRQRVAKYARLRLSILRDDGVQVTSCLQAKDYKENYAKVFEDEVCPGVFAIQFNRSNAIKAFVCAGVDLEDMYLLAVKIGNLEVIELCAERPGFDVNPHSEWGKKIFREVCKLDCKLKEAIQTKILKILVGRYRHKLNVPDSNGRTALYNICSDEVVRNLLVVFPEIDVNRKDRWGKNALLNKFQSNCNRFTFILEHGAFPMTGRREMQSPFYHPDRQNVSCKVIEHLQKLMLIDRKYARSTALRILGRANVKDAENLCVELNDQCQSEIAKMKSLQISQSTSFAPCKSLFDLIFFNPNQAARFSKNEIILQIYEEHKEDFSNFLPGYGFALNYQLRRGTVRRERLESAHLFLCSALGTGMPQDITEQIFGFFSNCVLERFSRECKVVIRKITV